MRRETQIQKEKVRAHCEETELLRCEKAKQEERLRSLEQEIGAHRQTIKTLKTEAEAVRALRSALEEREAKPETTHQKPWSGHTQSTLSTGSLEKRPSLVGDERQDFEAEREAMDMEIRTLRRELAERDAEVMRLVGESEKVTEWKLRADEFAAKNTRLQLEISRATTEHARLNHETAALRTEYAWTQKEGDRLAAENARLESDLTKLRTEHSLLKSENSQLKGQNTRLKNQSERMRKDAEVLAAAAEEGEEELKEAQRETLVSVNRQLLETARTVDGALRRLYGNNEPTIHFSAIARTTAGNR